MRDFIIAFAHENSSAIACMYIATLAAPLALTWAVLTFRYHKHELFLNKLSGKKAEPYITEYYGL